LSPSRIETLTFINPAVPIVDTAQAVGEMVAKELRRGSSVVVSLRGVRGASSSFFNVLLRLAQDASDGTLDHARLAFDFENQVQRLVYEKSLAALRAHSEPARLKPDPKLPNSNSERQTKPS
jgi:hypothetical protein